jgi:hypothetical protein
MLAFACPSCQRLVGFESVECLHCHTAIGYAPARRTMAALGGVDGELFACQNAEIAACNWLVDTPGELCASCRLTRTRPHDGDQHGLNGFARAEAAKRRLLFELADIGLPIDAWHEREGGLAFDLLSSEFAPVSTGHADGVITLDLQETDPAHRERMRVRLGEPYRTVLGHFRHEIGHYYQPLLVAPGTSVEERCRELFGDERADYKQALDRHYAEGAPGDWQQRFVSAYATMHPWEDWAETFAHYLHMRDTLQTAAAHGVRVDGPAITTSDRAPLDASPVGPSPDLGQMLRAWVPLTLALNEISRSMGELDLYPFVLGPAVDAKLAFVEQLLGADRHAANAA